jgi:hypothetical protein
LKSLLHAPASATLVLRLQARLQAPEAAVAEDVVVREAARPATREHIVIVTLAPTTTARAFQMMDSVKTVTLIEHLAATVAIPEAVVDVEDVAVDVVDEEVQVLEIVLTRVA